MKIYFGKNISIINNSLNNFCDNDRGKTVTHIYNFPSSIVTADNAFKNCSNLIEFNQNLSDNLKSINNMFSNCSKLTKSFNLPNNVENIVGVFENSNIKGNINFPISVKNATNAFVNSNIEYVTFNNMTSSNIQLNLNHTFYNCKNLKQIQGVIPNIINNLDHTFANSGIVNTPMLDNNISKEISCNGTFENCKQLLTANFNFPYQNTIESVFKGCSNLYECDNILSGTNIKNAFYGCSNLKNASIKNFSNMEQCFVGCNNLQDVYISSTKTSGNIINCFINCNNIYNIRIIKQGNIKWEDDLTYLQSNAVISLEGWNRANYNIVNDTALFYNNLKNNTSAYIDVCGNLANMFSITINNHNAILSNYYFPRNLSWIFPKNIRINNIHNSLENYELHIAPNCFIDTNVSHIIPLDSNIINEGFGMIKNVNTISLEYCNNISISNNTLVSGAINNFIINNYSNRYIGDTWFANSTINNLDLKFSPSIINMGLVIGNYSFDNAQINNFKINNNIVNNQSRIPIKEIGVSGFRNCINITDNVINIFPNATLYENCIFGTNIKNLTFNNNATLKSYSLSGLKDLNIDMYSYTNQTFGSYKLSSGNKINNYVFNCDTTINHGIFRINNIPNVNIITYNSSYNKAYYINNVVDDAPMAIIYANSLDYPNLVEVPEIYFVNRERKALGNSIYNMVTYWHKGYQGKYINIPNVTKIGYNAFDYCANLYITNKHLQVNQLADCNLYTNLSNLVTNCKINNAHLYTDTNTLLTWNTMTLSNESNCKMNSTFIGNWNIKVLGPSICYIDGANTNLGLTKYGTTPNTCNVKSIFLANGTHDRLCYNCNGNLYVWNSYTIDSYYSNNYSQFSSFMVSNSGIYKYYLYNSIPWSWSNRQIDAYFSKHNENLPSWLE